MIGACDPLSAVGMTMLVIDVVSRRAVTAVPFVSGALIVASFFKSSFLEGPAWRGIGRALISPFL